MIAVRWALYAVLMPLFGLPLFRVYALGVRTPQPYGALPPALAAGGLALSALGLMLLGATMFGMPVTGIGREQLAVLIDETALGAAWRARMTALALALVAGLWGRRRMGVRPALAVAAPAAVALGSLAWNGHGAAGEGAAGWLRLGSDIVHLLAAGVWVGALAAFALMLFSPALERSRERVETAVRALARFAVAGTAAVVAIVLTGLVNGAMLVGVEHVADLRATLYGRLLIAKLALFAGMLALAAANRFRLTGRLAAALATGDTRGAIGTLRLSIAVETGAALAVLALVAWLGTLEPPL